MPWRKKDSLLQKLLGPTAHLFLVLLIRNRFLVRDQPSQKLADRRHLVQLCFRLISVLFRRFLVIDLALEFGPLVVHGLNTLLELIVQDLSALERFFQVNIV